MSNASHFRGADGNQAREGQGSHSSRDQSYQDPVLPEPKYCSRALTFVITLESRALGSFVSKKLTSKDVTDLVENIPSISWGSHITPRALEIRGLCGLGK